MAGEARRLLARRVRGLRFVRHMSQEQLAFAAGLHPTYISMIERASCNPGLDNVEKLAIALEVSLLDLLVERQAEPGGRGCWGKGIKSCRIPQGTIKCPI